MEVQPPALLKSINVPSDLRKLKDDQLKQVCDELRQFIIDIVSVNGGHFGASLGVVELTVALHYAFNTPYDQLIWDVGHQAYGHKILTGRRDVFHTNRIYQGISGFPKRTESEYDTFGVGHSSTSISAALGMAVASRLKGEADRQHIAVIGDGAMTAGLAFEGLNHGGVEDSNLLVVLNDNCMSIDPNVGALKDYLTDITTSHTYNKVKDEVWNILGKISKFGPNAQAIAQKFENALKSALLKHSNLFESLKFRYFGPIDGHDVNHLVRVMKDLKDIPGPKILHCLTVKGKGYELAEKDQTKWHAPGLFDKITGEIFKPKVDKPTPPKYQDVFGNTLVELALKNKKIVGITPAMPSGCSMNIMMKAIPERAFDVGIAEQHAVTFSAGLASQGMIPFCNIYSSFMQRAYDQVVHDVCIQNLPVNFCLDRAGFAAVGIGPRDVAVDREIDLERRRTDTEVAVGARDSAGQFVAIDRQHLLRSQVEHDDVGVGDVGAAADMGVGGDGDVVVAERVDEGLGDRTGSALGDDPSVAVPAGQHHQAHGHHRVQADPGGHAPGQRRQMRPDQAWPAPHRQRPQGGPGDEGPVQHEHGVGENRPAHCCIVES